MKKLNSLSIILFILLFCTATQCDEGEYIPVTFENRTSETLFFVHNGRENFEDLLKGGLSMLILPNETTEVDHVYDSYEDVMIYYIFKESTLKRYTKEEIVEQNIYDKKYEFTIQQFEAIDFKIVYSGN